jgi:hypothetical protein
VRSAPAFFTATLAMLTALAYLFLSLFTFFLYSRPMEEVWSGMHGGRGYPRRDAYCAGMD